MEFGSIVLVVEFLLLLAGWLLFQQAKSELTARASEAPVLAEIKALQKSIAALLEQLKLESAQASAQLEARCVEARDLLSALDRRLESIQAGGSKRMLRRRPPPSEIVESAKQVSEGGAASTCGANRSEQRYQEIYDMADEGVASAVISQRTGCSEGEIELILGLRRNAGSAPV
jgi:hypothetical protein